MVRQKGRFQMAEQIKDFAGYVAQMREGIERDFPGPEPLTAARLLSGWRHWCAQHGQSAEMPPEVEPTGTATAEARGWWARAWEAGKVAKDYGSLGSTMSEDELARAWLALHGRGPSGLKFVED